MSMVRSDWFSALASRSVCLCTCRYTSRACMPTAHNTNIAAAKNSRLSIVARHFSRVDSLTLFTPRHDGRRRRLVGDDTLDHNRCAVVRCDEPQVSRGEPLDSLRRLERLDLQPEMPVDRLLVAALLLHLLEPVSVLQKLDPLPP